MYKFIYLMHGAIYVYHREELIWVGYLSDGDDEQRLSREIWRCEGLE